MMRRWTSFNIVSVVFGFAFLYLLAASIYGLAFLISLLAPELRSPASAEGA